jgi:hypothetical protein
MQGLNDDTKAEISALAGRFQISEGAVAAMLAAVKRGHGTMAQFDIGELGGHGQWMLGGMTMVGDMFNSNLKNTVDNLCNALSQALTAGRIDVATEPTGQGAWWPQWLGVPSSTGAQNDSAYAVFPSQHCLAIKEGADVALYDTQDHLITGVGQSQGSNRSQTFTSQRGSFSVSSLRQIEDAQAAGGNRSAHSNLPSNDDRRPAGASIEERLVDAAESRQPAAAPAAAPPAPAPAASGDGLQIIALIEKLAALRTAGILTDEEFTAKKAELLGRL